MVVFSFYVVNNGVVVSVVYRYVVAVVGPDNYTVTIAAVVAASYTRAPSVSTTFSSSSSLLFPI